LLTYSGQLGAVSGQRLGEKARVARPSFLAAFLRSSFRPWPWPWAATLWRRRGHCGDGCVADVELFVWWYGVPRVHAARQQLRVRRRPLVRTRLLHRHSNGRL